MAYLPTGSTFCHAEVLLSSMVSGCNGQSLCASCTRPLMKRDCTGVLLLLQSCGPGAVMTMSMH